MTVAFLAETVSQLDEQLYTLLRLLKKKRELKALIKSNACVCVCVANLCCDVEVLVLLQQLLRVMDARASGGVCGKVKLPSVMNPLQSLKRHKHTRQIYCQIT